MRLKLGRPDLGRYAAHFDVPSATEQTPLAVTFLGVASLLIEDGTSAIMTDGFFSRPGLRQVLTGSIAPNLDRIDRCLQRAGVRSLAAVVPVHSHYDHALDSAAVAERTGAVLVGGESTANIGRGHGLDPARILTPTGPVQLGNYVLNLIGSRHCPPDRFPGTIDAPLTTPARASRYRCGEAWSLHVRHEPSQRSLLVQGSAGFVPGALAGVRADVVYLGVGQLGIRPSEEIRQYWAETVRTIGARRVVLIHWDDFFRPLDEPLRANPYAADDLDVTMRIVTELAAADQVALHLPTLWRREDPWAPALPAP